MKRRWSIWWIDGRVLAFDAPVHGRFEDSVGTLIGDDTFEGRPIQVRFTWSDITADSARWQQAFSEDGGKNWELNWDMRFSRVGLPDGNLPFVPGNVGHEGQVPTRGRR